MGGIHVTYVADVDKDNDVVTLVWCFNIRVIVLYVILNRLKRQCLKYIFEINVSTLFKELISVITISDDTSPEIQLNEATVLSKKLLT